MAPTSWPAANTLTCSRPPESAVIDCATRSAPDWRPGKLFGQMVTILSSRTPWAIAGFGKADAAAATPTLSARNELAAIHGLSPGWLAGLPFFSCKGQFR